MEFIQAVVSQLVADPDNPRKNFVQDAFDDLVESVKAKGVLQPILIRPYNGYYMIVAGERRWRAATEAGLETIPAVIRETENGEVFEIQMVENLMRADITELEEAQGFDKYLKTYPERTTEELAAKTGCDPRFIRRRLAIVNLPDKLLKLWDKDKISFAALEQLLRVDNPQDVYDVAVSQTYRGSVTADTIRDIIEKRAPLLKEGLFVKTDCSACPANTKIQKDLFGDDFAADKVRCLKPECFLDKQKAYLIDTHSETPGVLIVDRPDHQNLTTLPKKRKECKKCDNFVTEIEVMNARKRECCKVKACIHDPASEKIPSVPRRANPDKDKERFYKEVLGAIEIPQEKQLKAAMLMMMETDGRFREVGKEVLKLQGKGAEYYHATTGEMLTKLDEHDNLGAVLNAMVTKYTTRDGYAGKADLAEWLGTSIAESFVIDDVYLRRRDRNQIVELAKELKIMTPFKENIRKEKPEWTGDFENVLKKVMVDAFLACDFAGKVPKEIRS